jgi:hypothetical protein
MALNRHGRATEIGRMSAHNHFGGQVESHFSPSRGRPKKQNKTKYQPRQYYETTVFHPILPSFHSLFSAFQAKAFGLKSGQALKPNSSPPPWRLSRAAGWLGLITFVSSSFPQ